MFSAARCNALGLAHRSVFALAFALVCLWSGVARSAAPTEWTSTQWDVVAPINQSCATCHGNPLQISDDGRTGLTSLETNLPGKNALGDFTWTASGVMSTFFGPGATSASTTQRNNILAYLIAVRDGRVEVPVGTVIAGTGSLDFGSVNVGSSTLRTFRVANERERAFTFSVSGLAGTNFTVNSTTCTSVASGGSCDVTLRFAPTGTSGPRSATVSLSLVAAPAAGVLVADPALRSRTISLSGTANALPVFAVAPSTLNFATPAGTAVTATATVSNTGNAAMTLGAFTFSRSEYVLDGSSICATSGTVAAGGSCSVVVRFSSASAGSFPATLQIAHSAAGSPATVSLNGSASTVAAPSFAALPTTLTFTAPVGGADLRSTTFSNPGTASLSLNAITVSGTGFTRDASSTCAAGGSVAAGGSCTLVVRFAPTGAGGATGSVVIAHNAAGSPGTVTLNGTGTTAGIAASPSALGFGSVQLGSSAAQVLTITNTGSAPLTLASTGTVGGANAADFGVSATTCSTASAMAPGASCTISVAFTPAAAGARSASITVASDAPSGALVVALSGTGSVLAQPSVTGPGSAFPDTVIGEASPQTRSVTITNPRATAVGFSLSGHADFAVTTSSCATPSVPAGGTCVLDFTFRPAAGAAGLRSANLPITFTGSGGDADPGPANVGLSGTALLPLQLSATALSMSATVGAASISAVTLTNLGSNPLTLVALGFSGSHAAEYTVDASSGCRSAGVIAASGNCTLVLRFAPTAAGSARNATLEVAYAAGGSAAAGSPQVVSISGAASNAPQGTLAVSASTINFADTTIGSTATQVLAVENTGAAAVNFAGLTLAGTQAADFTTSGTCVVGTPLAAGARCDVDMQFAPTAVGTRNATFTLASDASNASLIVVLGGTGTAVPTPVVTLSPPSLDFGTQTVGGAYLPRSMRLQNSGTAALSLVSVTSDNAAFVVDASACPPQLAAGDACDLSLRFSPSAVQSYSGALVVSSNAAGSPQQTTLRGQGSALVAPALNWVAGTPTSLDFGTVTAGASSMLRTLTLRNAGPGGATVALLNAVGVDGAVFSVAGGSCAAGATVFEGDTCTVDIRFTPATSGARQATLQVASNGSAPQAVLLQGVGLGHPSATLAASAAALDFGSVRLGAASAPLQLRLNNSGNGSLMVMGFDLAGPYAMQGGDCPSAAPFVLAAGAACHVNLVFTPQAEGAAVGALSVSSDAPSGTVQVALQGQAEAAPVVSSSGGCSVVADPGAAATDPTLWLLVLLALTVLVSRARAERGRLAGWRGRVRGGGR